MKHRLATFCFTAACLALIVGPVSAYWQTRVIYKPTGSGPAGCTESATFLTAADAVVTVVNPYRDAYKVAICALYSTSSTLGGSLASKMDFLYFIGTQASGIALINAVNPGTYNGSVVGAGPSFTAAQGYTQTSAGTLTFLTSNFNPSSASSPKYVLNSAHNAFYVRAAGTNTEPVASQFVVASGQTALFSRYSDGKAYMRLNDTSTGSGGGTVATATGYYLGVRPDASTNIGYKTGSSIGLSPSDTSDAVPICPLMALGNMNEADCAGSLTNASQNYQISLWHAGSQYSATDAAALNTIFAAFGTAVGW